MASVYLSMLADIHVLYPVGAWELTKKTREQLLYFLIDIRSELI